MPQEKLWSYEISWAQLCSWLPLVLNLESIITHWSPEVKCLPQWRGCANVTSDPGAPRATEPLICLLCAFLPCSYLSRLLITGGAVICSALSGAQGDIVLCVFFRAFASRTWGHACRLIICMVEEASLDVSAVATTSAHATCTYSPGFHPSFMYLDFLQVS